MKNVILCSLDTDCFHRLSPDIDIPHFLTVDYRYHRGSPCGKFRLNYDFFNSHSRHCTILPSTLIVASLPLPVGLFPSRHQQFLDSVCRILFFDSKYHY